MSKKCATARIVRARARGRVGRGEKSPSLLLLPLTCASASTRETEGIELGRTRERGEGKEEGRISSSPYEERVDACMNACVCGKERNKNMRKMREGEKGERKGKREREVVVRERERGGMEKTLLLPLTRACARGEQRKVRRSSPCTKNNFLARGMKRERERESERMSLSHLFFFFFLFNFIFLLYKKNYFHNFLFL